MISKCANPVCSARFLYLHKGKLFRFEREAQDDAQPLLGFDPALHQRSTGVEFFWLCENCAATTTLVYRRGAGVTMLALRGAFKAVS